MRGAEVCAQTTEKTTPTEHLFDPTHGSTASGEAGQWQELVAVVSFLQAFHFPGGDVDLLTCETCEFHPGPVGHCCGHWDWWSAGSLCRVIPDLDQEGLKRIWTPSLFC